MSIDVFMDSTQYYYGHVGVSPCLLDLTLVPLPLVTGLVEPNMSGSV